MIDNPEALQNSLLWTVPKGQAASHETKGQMFLFHGFIYSTDGYILLAVPYHLDSTGVATADEVKLALKEDREPEWGWPEDNSFFWDSVLEYWATVVEEPTGKALSSPFAISPERLSKFSRLKPQGEYPIDFRYVTVDDRQLFRFKYGPEVRGVMSALDRESLLEAFEGKPGVLW